MKEKVTLIGVVLILALLTVACGGASEPVVSNDAGATEATVEEEGENAAADQATEENEAESDSATASEETSEADESAEAADEATDEAAAAETSAEEETSPEEETADGDAGSGETVAGRPASGADPETGMQINPPELIQGEEFIVRGEIISLNLTPQTTPEFLVEAPNGQKFRIRSQELSAVTYEDGTTVAPHEFRQGMLAEATVYQDPSADLTTLVESEDFRLLKEE